MNEQNQNFTLDLVQPTALESLERANVDMQINTAKRFPRSLSAVKNRMLDLATLDQETAESCFYKLSRSGKSIEGPSIRLAEIAASSFGNVRYGARVIANDGKKITAQGFAHDLETNVYCAVEVSRRITNRDGATYSDDMQIVTGNAACAIALRNAMFKVVPFALVKPVYERAKQAAVGDIKTLAERRTRMVKQFAAMGIDEKRVLAAVEKNGIEEIGLTELETLIGLYNAVKDGEQKIDEAFPPAIAKPSGLPKTDEEKPKRTTKKKPEETPSSSTSASSAPSVVDQITAKLTESGHTPAQLLRVAITNNWCETTVTDLSQIDEPKLRMFLDNWEGTLDELKLLKEPQDKPPFD